MSTVNDTAAANSSTVCIIQHMRSKGIFFGDNPLHYAGPVLLSQLIVSALLSSILQFFLSPIGETAFVSQTLAGLTLGPSVLGKFALFRDHVFPPGSFYVTETLAYFGLMLFLFMVGVKTDPTILMRTGKKPVFIGLCNFFIPLSLNVIVAIVLLSSVPMDPDLYQSLAWIATFQCVTSFHVIASVLADLQLLDSEVGRTALSASMVSGSCSWCWAIMLYMARQVGGEQRVFIVLGLVISILTAIIIYALRPIMLWMVRRTGDGKVVKESYILSVFIMILGCSLFSDIIGQSLLLGPIILGIAVPEGPPLGSTLVTKLETFVSSILLPIYFVITGANIDFSGIHAETFVIVQLLACFSFLWKMLSTLLPSLYAKMSVNDALSLSLIMSVQGITDVLLIGRAAQLEFIDREAYSIMVLSIVGFTATVTPIVKLIYKPNRKYTAYKRRTIQHAITRGSCQLRILACIYYEDHTPSIINLLEASNPTTNDPIFFHAVHLIELSGRSAPLLVEHQPGKKHPPHSDHIINAFQLYERNHNGMVTMITFTAIAPYATMHDEICALALGKKVSMVILPFHKLWKFCGTQESEKSIRAVNRNVLRMAPCSVGILIDRGSNMTNKIRYRIAVIFIGGKDDREALAYASRMAKHPNVGLTVVRIVEYSNKSKHRIITPDMAQDMESLKELQINNTKNEKYAYKEEIVRDSEEMVSVIGVYENSFDLILVGRRHDSRLVAVLTEWNEFPELGFIGDMLASTDSNCRVSVLVVQQQLVVGGRGDMPDSPVCAKQDACAVVDMPFDKNKVSSILMNQ